MPEIADRKDSVAVKTDANSDASAKHSYSCADTVDGHNARDRPIPTYQKIAPSRRGLSQFVDQTQAWTGPPRLLSDRSSP
jgi:hypothetical protein